jgi:SAM-dependent methyltransferase
VQPNEYEIMFRAEETHWWYRALRRIVSYNLDCYLPCWREERILDGGCGTGANLASFGHCVDHIGLDLAEQALEFSARRGLSKLVQGDVSALPFRAGVLAAVLSTSVLYHRWVPSVDLALRECHRVLRDGGFLLLELPAYKFLGSAHDEAVDTARRFTRREVVDSLCRNGFTVRRATYWNTLLFPMIWLIRAFKLMRSGRDFGPGRGPSPAINALLDAIMRVEFLLLKCFPLPFGVSISCVAQKASAPMAQTNSSAAENRI